MQTHFKFLCMACTVLLCYSCGGNNPQTTSGYSEYEKPDTTNSVQEMKDYHYSAEVKVGQTRYTYDIVREVNDTLPLVTGDDGERYADNYIRLRVNREGKEIFNKVFTKNHFRSYMEKDSYPTPFWREWPSIKRTATTCVLPPVSATRLRTSTSRCPSPSRPTAVIKLQKMKSWTQW